MNDKLYDLVEKMYIEFSGRIGTLEKGQKELQLTIENNVSEKIKTLYDDRVEIKESLACINSKLDNMAKVDENHELRIRVLEGGKQAV